MFVINKLRADSAIDYAAEEMRKYLWMMMPELGDVKINYNPEATDGFRLGLLEDFGLPCDVEDPVLDDIIHVDCDTQGGILAGSNPRSVLFSVYRFFRENGCRWLYPGVDGDYVPVQDIVPVKYHKAADHRLRGFCDEGAESQQCMLESIEFYAKLELNTFMLEFFLPRGYYSHYYKHENNEENRPNEMISDEQIIQWRRMCEVELNKRGMINPSIGHGWTTRPFGLPYDRQPRKASDYPQVLPYIAVRNGEKEFPNGQTANMQICLSNPVARKMMVDDFIDFSKKHQNLTYVCVGLSDGPRFHCECEECVKMRPADWYMMLLNEMDEALTAEGMDTRIRFSAYLDTYFAPEKIKLKNPKRFLFSYAPISRDYTTSVDENTVVPEAPEYVRNAWKAITTEQGLALLKKWTEALDCPKVCYEYHFWRHQYLDPGSMQIARRIYEDVRALKHMGLRGLVEDGSQRSFFPNGFPMYLYAEVLMDRECDYEAVRADYYEHIYGKDWQQVVTILEEISGAFDLAYMEGVRSEDIEIDKFYAPSRVPRIQTVHELAAQIRALCKAQGSLYPRVQTVSWKLLNRYSEYVEYMADVITERALGNFHKANELQVKFAREFGKYEQEIERYYDQYLSQYSLKMLLRLPAKRRDFIWY